MEREIFPNKNLCFDPGSRPPDVPGKYLIAMLREFNNTQPFRFKNLRPLNHDYRRCHCWIDIRTWLPTSNIEIAYVDLRRVECGEGFSGS